VKIKKSELTFVAVSRYVIRLLSISSWVKDDVARPFLSNVPSEGTVITV